MQRAPKATLREFLPEATHRSADEGPWRKGSLEHTIHEQTHLRITRVSAVSNVLPFLHCSVHSNSHTVLSQVLVDGNGSVAVAYPNVVRLVFEGIILSALIFVRFDGQNGSRTRGEHCRDLK